jgi:rubrerythrin
MKIGPKTKPYDILALGIKSEIDAADLYRGLRSRVKNILLGQKLDFLITEEKHHRDVLERLFHDRFSDRRPVLPAASFVSKSLGPKADKLSVRELFEAALEAEKVSEEFYKNAAAAGMGDASRRILAYLSRVERSHYFMIKSELDLLSRFPDYYKVNDIQVADDMVHVGP